MHITNVNASHAVSYAILTYLSAWLKVHYPREFMANTLTNAYESNKEPVRIGEMVAECQCLGVQFLPVDANRSGWKFTVEGDRIRIGLCALKGFGAGGVEALKSIRPITSYEQVIGEYTRKGTKLNKKYLTVLIFSHALDFLNLDAASRLYRMLFVKAAKKAQQAGIALPEKFPVSRGYELSLHEPEAGLEAKMFRVNYFHRPGAELAPIGFASKHAGERFEGVVQITWVRRKEDRNGNEMAWVRAAASDEEFRGTIFASSYRSIDSSLLREGQVVRITAKKDREYKGEGSCVIFGVKAA